MVDDGEMHEETVLLVERDIFPHGPFRVTVEFELDVGEDRTAHVDFAFPPGLLPTPDELAAAAESVKTEVGKQFSDARWPTRKEFGEQDIINRTGMRMTFTRSEEPFEHGWAKQ